MKKPAVSENKKRKLKNLPYALAEKAFLIFILLFFSSAFLIFVFLYQPLKNQKEILVSEEDVPAQFDEKSFQEVLDQQAIKENRLLNIDLKSYPDIFSKKDSFSQGEISSIFAPSSAFISSSSQTGTVNNSTGAAATK